MPCLPEDGQVHRCGSRTTSTPSHRLIPAMNGAPVPTYLVKPSPDEDFYLVWDTDASAVAAHGSLADLRSERPDLITPEHTEAADARGTTAPEISGFADLAYGQDTLAVARPGGIDMVARKRIQAYLEAKDRGADTGLYAERSMELD